MQLNFIYPYIKRIRTMANYNKMEMVKTLSDKHVVTLKNGFLGFGNKVILNENGTTMRAGTKEYTPENGTKLLHIITLAPDAIVEQLSAARIEAAGVGNIRLETLLAEDGQTLFMQMFKYVNFKSTAISDLITVSGSHARSIAGLL